MRGQQVIDRAVEADPSAEHQDQVVGDALQLGEEVRGEHHGHTVVSHRRHHRRHEVVTGQRVQRCRRLVQDEQPWVARQREGQGQLRSLPTGELPGTLLRLDAEIVQTWWAKAVSKDRLRLFVRFTMSPTENPR